MQPSERIVRALVAQGFHVDSSVFKYGRRAGIVSFDYRDAPSPLHPWRVDPRDVCRVDAAGELLEFPIYSEHRRVHRFISPERVHRAVVGRRHAVPGGGAGSRGLDGAGPRRAAARMAAGLSTLSGRHAWKLDFNQCSGRQLIAGIGRAERAAGVGPRSVPLVLIGHSKLFTRFNERRLEPFLAYVAAHPDRFRFATLSEALRMYEAPPAVAPAP